MSDTIDSIANGIRYAVSQLGDDMPYIVMARQMRSLADDIVAAHKREIDKLKEQIEDLRQQRDVWSKRADELKMKCDEHYAKLKQVGNVAKLREALEYMFILIDEQHLVLECETTEEISGVQSKLAEARAALAEPPRNCDRPECATTKAAADVWRKENGGKTAYYDWLLAPSTEKEGGSK